MDIEILKTRYKEYVQKRTSSTAEVKTVKKERLKPVSAGSSIPRETLVQCVYCLKWTSVPSSFDLNKLPEHYACGYMKWENSCA